MSEKSKQELEKVFPKKIPLECFGYKINIENIHALIPSGTPHEPVLEVNIDISYVKKTKDNTIIAGGDKDLRFTLNDIIYSDDFAKSVKLKILANYGVDVKKTSELNKVIDKIIEELEKPLHTLRKVYRRYNK